MSMISTMVVQRPGQEPRTFTHRVPVTWCPVECTSEDIRATYRAAGEGLIQMFLKVGAQIDPYHIVSWEISFWQRLEWQHEGIMDALAAEICRTRREEQVALAKDEPPFDVRTDAMVTQWMVVRDLLLRLRYLMDTPIFKSVYR